MRTRTGIEPLVAAAVAVAAVAFFAKSLFDRAQYRDWPTSQVTAERASLSGLLLHLPPETIAPPPGIHAREFAVVDLDSAAYIVGSHDQTPQYLGTLAYLFVAHALLEASTQSSLDVSVLAHEVLAERFPAHGREAFAGPTAVLDLVSRLTNGSDPSLKLLLDEHLRHQSEALQRLMKEQVLIARAATSSGRPAGDVLREIDLFAARDMAFAASFIIERHHMDRHFEAGEWWQPIVIDTEAGKPITTFLLAGDDVTRSAILATIAERPRLVAVVIGGGKDEPAVQASRLLDYAHRAFETKRIVRAEEQLDPDVLKSAPPRLDALRSSLCACRDIFVTYPRGYYKRVRERLVLADSASPPWRAGQLVGNLIVSFDEQTLAVHPVTIRWSS